MKTIITLAALCLYINLSSQNSVKFQHDAGGNITQRYTRSMNLRVGRTTSDSLLSFKVYPNPTKDYVTIEGTLHNDKAALVSIYDINGALLKQDTYEGVQKTIRLNGYANGIYFLELKYADRQSANYKLVITD